MAAFVAAIVVLTAVTLPPATIRLASTADDGTVRGVIHVHTNRSDGGGAPDDVAAAAARAGLKFLVFTDHGDGTRQPDPPTYRSGVLCLDAVEISTTGGHYVALDMRTAPYRLGGEPRDVVEDVRRLGGFGIAAHPDSPSASFRWRDWTAPIDGVELLNPDTSWRDLAMQPGWRPKLAVLAALLHYPWRPAETIASRLQDSGAVVPWLGLAERRRVVALAGLDAHAKLEWRGEGDTRYGLPIPSYEAAFHLMSIHVALERPFSGNAAADAAVLMRAIRGGHLYTAVDALATPPSFQFSATNAFATVHEGDELAAGGVDLHVRSNAPAGFTTILHDGTQTIGRGRDTATMTVPAREQGGVYWVEIQSTDRRNVIPWIRSNPIYVRPSSPVPAPPAAHPPATISVPLFDGSLAGWEIETDAASKGNAMPESSAVRFQFSLGGPEAKSPYVTLRRQVSPGTVTADGRLALSIRADRPMRLSVQLRTLANDRWERSIYVDRIDRDRIVPFDDLVALGPHGALSYASVNSILFVVDQSHTKPGTTGSVWISKVALER